MLDMVLYTDRGVLCAMAAALAAALVCAEQFDEDESQTCKRGEIKWKMRFLRKCSFASLQPQTFAFISFYFVLKIRIELWGSKCNEHVGSLEIAS